MALSGRGRIFYGTAIWSFIAKAAAGICLLLSMPMVIAAFGIEQFGAFATLSSFVAIAPLLDFGFGNSALNLISDARGRQAERECSFLLKLAAITAAKIALLLSVPAVVAVFLSPWWSILGLLRDMDQPAKQAAAIGGLAFIVNIPLAVGARVQLALDQAASAFRWQTAGQLIALAAIYLVCQSKSATFPMLCAAGILPPTLCAATNCFLMLRRRAWHSVDQDDRALITELARKLRRQSCSFFMLQISAVLAYSSDLAIISSRLGATDAATYAASQRVFSIIPTAASLLWAPLWPQYRRALAAGEFGWTRRTFRRSLLLAVGGASALAAGTFIALPWIVAVLGHGKISPAVFLNAGFAVWVVLDCVGGAVAALLNAGNILRFQLILALVFALVSCSAKIALAPALGVSGIPWITCSAYAGLVLFPIFMARRRIARALFASH
ncbi:hypothetical protein QTI17_12035 [Variovorax sp. J31P179]|uniref:lipopolysaccharide biosynthesis protein n=1 Tax=Variovorax sp. J31P179 TaxID=3053508 RepID=UPI002574EFD3|nr:hypothetical protein [Variovorax sp. J31P179]MDM0081326.1 hypothetical protein [Variovorax sp. J31P179]